MRDWPGGVVLRMANLTVPMPEEDLQFLVQWTAALGTSAEAWVADYARNLREAADRGTHAHVIAATGVLPDDGKDYSDYRERHLDSLEEKHR